MNSISYSLIYSACLALIVNCGAAKNVYIVGDSMGWTVPPNTSFYSNWASSKTFMVGDILVFNFTTSGHDVVQVPKASYDKCSDDGAMGYAIVAGPVNVTLDSAGDHYYIDSIGTHCQSGQKLSIRVLNSSSTPGGGAPPPPPLTAPPPTIPTTPLPASPNKTGSTPPPPPPTTSTTPLPASPNMTGSPPPPPPMSSSSVSMGGSFLIIATCAALALIV